MKRWLRYAVIAVLLAGMAAGAGALGWLLGTPAGARRLMDTISRHTQYSISARRVEGSIWKGLRLEGARVQWPRGDAGFGAMRLRWQPLFLVVGKVSISELYVKGARIRDDRPASKAPPELGWPRVTGIPAWLNMRIRKMTIEGLEYRRLGGAPLIVSGVSARVMWQGSLLTVRDLAVTTPSLHADGGFMAGFRRPTLLLKLRAGPKRPVAGLDGLSCEARLFPASDPEQIAGPVTISGLSGGKRFLDLAGEIGITRNSVNLRKLRLEQSGRRGTVNGEGTLAFTGEKPLLSLRMGFAGLDLSRELRTATSLSGTLSVDGNQDSYRGKFVIANKVAGWRAGRVSGTFLGDGAGVKLTALEGLALDGTVTGDVQADWRKGIVVRGSLRGRNLNPEKVTTKWKGVVNLDLSGSAAWSGTKLSRAELKARLLESRLHGKTLTGEADVSITGDNLLFRRMELHGKGFDIRAEGELRKQLVFSAKVGDLSGLVPETAGKLDASGWVRWRDKRLSGSVTGGVRNLSAAGIRVSSSDLSASLGEGRGYPLRIDAKARGVSYSRLRLDSVTISAAGGVENHSIETALRASDLQASATLSGGYRKGAWQGVISRFSGRDAVGPWNMVAPVSLRVGADSVSLSRLSLNGASGEHLEADGQVTLHPLRGFIRTEWRSLNLARFSRLSGATALTGLSSGAMQVRWPGQDRLLVSGRADASGTVTVDGHRIQVRQASVHMEWNERGMLAPFDLRLADGGVLKGLFSSPQPARMAVPSRGSFKADWNALDIALARPWLPRGFDMEGRFGGGITGELTPGMRLDVRGKAALSGGIVNWRENKNQLSAFISTADVSWAWQGGKATVGPGKEVFQTSRIMLDGRIEATGNVVLDGHRIKVEQTSLRLDWSEQGMRNALEVSLAGGGKFRGSFSSPLPARMTIPRQGTIEADWRDVDVALLHPWFPAGLGMEGRLTGKVKGDLLPGGRVDAAGNATVSRGVVSWSSESGQFNASLSAADVSWAWRGDGLTGDISLALEEQGNVRAGFQIPLEARLPAAVNQAGPVMVNVTGAVRETGILTSLFPGLIRESRGELIVDARVGGQWQNPDITGNLKLGKASAYLPTAGVQLKNVEMAARFVRDQLVVDSFKVESGPGRIGGNGIIRLKDWRVAGYEGTIKGDRFQVVYLPDLQVLANPNLNFTGSPGKLSVRGEIVVPELLVNEQQSRAPIQPSEDVVIEGETGPAQKKTPAPLDIQVTVTLGDKVRLKLQGLEAQLKGSLKLVIRRLDEIRSTGEIRVVKGSYKTYGISLDITRGRVYYAGGPIDQPTLDIQALRKVGDVRAGVTIAGTPRTMAVKLYSQPNMPDSAILSYIILGQPLAYTGEQRGLVTRAAGQLLSTTSGYKPIQVSPPGVAPSKTAGATLSQSVVSVGRYLTPKLYISYGRSLLTSANLVRLRYDLSRHWEVETQTGTESGGDIFFKINFR